MSISREKKILTLLIVGFVFTLSCFGTFMPQNGPVITLAGQISWLKLFKSKSSLDNIKIWEEVRYALSENRILIQKSGYDTGRGFFFCGSYEDDFLDDLFLKAAVSFELLKEGSSFIPGTLQAVLGAEYEKDGFLLGYHEPFEDVSKIMYEDILDFPGLELGYSYSFNKPGCASALVAGFSLRYESSKTGNVYKAWGSGKFRFAGKKIKPEDSRAGLQVRSNIQTFGFDIGAEYRYSYDKTPAVNGIYLSFKDIAAVIGYSSLPSGLGVDVVFSFHKIEQGIKFDLNYIYLPLVIKYVPYTGRFNGFAGLDHVEYNYSADNEKWQNGFFFVFDIGGNADVSNAFEFDFYNRYSLGIKRIHKKTQADFFMLTYLH